MTKSKKLWRWQWLKPKQTKQPITKAIIPAAGLGTRFLPATKAQPKEMLPIIDKPAIQYIIEEAMHSGIEEILVITGRNKRSIEDHFDRSVELEMALKKSGKYDLLGLIEEISHVKIHYIRQKEAKGLGHAVLCAKQFVGNEPFAVMLGDDIVDAAVPCLKQLMDVYEDYPGTILGVQEVPLSSVSSYGIVKSVPLIIACGRLSNLLKNRLLLKRRHGWRYLAVILLNRKFLLF